MAISTGGEFTFGRKSPVRSRNIAFLSIVGVITGTVLIFRALKPAEGIISSDERYAIRGGNPSPGDQTDQGTIKSAPRPQPQVKKYPTGTN